MTLLVKDLMQKKVVSFSPSIGLDVLEQGLIQQGISGAPVVEDNKVVGVVSRSDIVKQMGIAQTYAVLAYDYYDAPICGSNENISSDKSVVEIGNAAGQQMEQLTVKDVMKHDIISVSPKHTLNDAADLMLERKIHRLLVLESGGLAGVLSASDFVNLYSSQRC